MLGDRAGERALIVALRDVFGLEGTLTHVEVAGRTDRWLVAPHRDEAHDGQGQDGKCSFHGVPLIPPG